MQPRKLVLLLTDLCVRGGSGAYLFTRTIDFVNYDDPMEGRGHLFDHWIVELKSVFVGWENVLNKVSLGSFFPQCLRLPL